MYQIIFFRNKNGKNEVEEYLNMKAKKLLKNIRRR